MVFYFLDCFILFDHTKQLKTYFKSLKHSELYCCHIEQSAQLVFRNVLTVILIYFMHKKFRLSEILIQNLGAN